MGYRLEGNRFSLAMLDPPSTLNTSLSSLSMDSIKHFVHDYAHIMNGLHKVLYKFVLDKRVGVKKYRSLSLTTLRTNSLFARNARCFFKGCSKEFL